MADLEAITENKNPGPYGREYDLLSIYSSKQSMLRILWISAFFLSHQTLPSWSELPEGVVIFAFLHSTQCLILLPPKATKQVISLFFAICMERFPHQTVPGEGFCPPGFVS